MRTRDVGFATVDYSNGLTLGALSLTETVAVDRPNGSLFATGLVSLFHDGRWSMQGGITGSRFSAPIAAGGPLRPWFRTVRGEVSLNSTSTLQQGFMPTLQLLGQARVHLIADAYALRGGAALTRAFDGFAWRTTVMGDAGGWARVRGAIVSYTATPMQLQYGDVLADQEAAISFSRGRVTWDASFGLRLGEALRGTDSWGAVNATWPLRAGALATAGVGSYPIDLIQGLPGGRYVALGMRLPSGGLAALRAPRRLPPPPPPERPNLPITERLSLVIGPSLDSLGLREVRVWAPGVRTVELLGDFTEWIPVPLIRQPNGEWRGYYHVTPGVHRINLRLERTELDVPVNLARVKDEFTGDVGLIIVR
ncbi:MAG: hypothetical protein IT359_21315 [Gemmatimonadaceae bacterium]|nr:hypothetical protein [Gemmatimonadaceae bacterium]